MKKFVLLLMLLATAALGQNGYYTSQATGVSPFGHIVGIIPIAYGQVRVCTSADIGTKGTPCPDPAVITDVSSGQVLTIQGGNFGQITTDVTGRFSFGCATGSYWVQVAASSSNTPQINYPVTCPITTGGGGGGNTGLTSWVDVTGALYMNGLPNGTTDNTTAIQSAINAAPTGGVVYFPPAPNCYVVTGLTVNKPISLVGGYGKNSCLLLKGGISGPIVTIQANVILSPEGFLYGVEVRDLYFNCNLRQAGGIGIKVLTLEQSDIHENTFESCQSGAIQAFTSFRESVVWGNHGRWNGDESASACAFDFREQVANTAKDPHNGIKFYDNYSVYSYGDDVCMDTTTGNPNIVRDNTVIDNFFHGPVPGFNTGGNSAPTAGQLQGVRVRVGSAQFIKVAHNHYISAGISQPFYYQWVGSNATGPSSNIFDDNETRGRYGDPVSDGTHQCVLVDSGDLTVENNQFDGCNDNSVKSTASTVFIHLGTNNILPGNGPLSLAGSVGMFYGDSINNKIGLLMGNLNTNPLVCKQLQLGDDVCIVNEFPSIAFNLYPSGVLWKFMTGTVGSPKNGAVMQFDYNQNGIQFYTTTSGGAQGGTAPLVLGPIFNGDGSAHFPGGVFTSGVTAGSVVVGASPSGGTFTNTALIGQGAGGAFIMGVASTTGFGASGTLGGGICINNTNYAGTYAIAVLSSTRYSFTPTGAEPTGCGAQVLGNITFGAASTTPTMYAQNGIRLGDQTNGPGIFFGTGVPSATGATATLCTTNSAGAPLGSLYIRTDNIPGVGSHLYVCEGSAGNAVWTAK